MRIDEINLLGQFKITGNTGNNSQAIGMSGGSTSFIDVVAGGGSSEGLVKRSGYNYIIVEATGNAAANGNKLKTAYNNAVTLLSQIGTPAPDNRVSILLTPGDYDLGGDSLNVTYSFIDIVGISQNPLDTIIRASNEFVTIRFIQPGVDFGLYNIDLRSGGTGEQVAFWDSGGGNTYLRMKNVVISGNGFYSVGFNSINQGFNGIVNSIAIQPDGKILVGGDFNQYTSTNLVTTSSYKIIRLNSDGTADNTFLSINNGFNGIVYSIVIQPDGKILVGGDFTDYNGTGSNNIIRLNSDGSIDGGFLMGSGMSSGFNDRVHSISIQSDGKILVGGRFGLYAGTYSDRIIRLNSDGSVDNTFLSINGGFNGIVYSISIQSDGKILVGGSFDQYTDTISNTTISNKIIRLNSGGSVDAGFQSNNGGFSTEVNSIAIQSDGKILVGGDFVQYTETSSMPILSRNIIRLNSDGTVDNTFLSINGGFDYRVTSITIQPDGKILVGGQLGQYTDTNSNTTISNGIIRLNSDGSADTGFLSIGGGFIGGSSVNSITIQSDGKILVGGSFTEYSVGGGVGTTSNNIIRLYSNGSVNINTSLYSFYDLDGEFEDITSLDGCNFAVATNSLSGTYKNIKIGIASYAFYTLSTGTLTGTYKNITISNLLEYGFYGIINGIFEDIKVNCNTGTSYIFSAGTVGVGTITGYFKNIILSGSHDSVFYAQTTGIYEDIEISTTGHAFESTDSFIDGTFKNIKIGDVTIGSVFSSSGNIYGTFSNIEIGNVTSNVFYADPGIISINIKDAKIGNVGGNIFYQNDDGSESTYLSGTYKNLTIGDVTGSCFLAFVMSGTFDTIQIGNASGFFRSEYTSGTFKNIKGVDVGAAFSTSSGDVYGTFKSISINSSGGFFTGNNINGTFDDISVVSNSGNSFYGTSILFGTFSNIKVDSTSGAIISDDTLGGYYDGITIGTSLGAVFNSGSSPVQGTFKNIKVTSCSSFFTSTSTIEPTLVENVEVGECTPGNFIATAVGSLGGTYKNIKVSSVDSQSIVDKGISFHGYGGITGTYSNIEVGYCSNEVFFSTGSIDVDIDDMKIIAPSSFIFSIPGGSGVVIGKINKLVSVGATFPTSSDYLNNVTFGGLLKNSYIEIRPESTHINISGATVERCKIITSSLDGMSLEGTGQVIYTMTNQSIDVTGATQNVTDTSIIS